jgi:hypothetical protein
MRVYFDELAVGLGWKPKELLAMLWHYLDESGVHAADGTLERLTLGGCVATAEAWSAFCPVWQKILDDFKIPMFHMSDFQAWKPPFDFLLENGERDWPKHKELMNRALDAIIDHASELLGFVSEPESGKDAFKDSYESNIAKAVLEASKDVWHTENPVTMVFAKHRDFKASQIAEYFEMWDDCPGLAFGGVADPKCVLPLQAADLVAYEMRCYTRKVQPVEVRYGMKRLADAFQNKQKIKDGRFVVTHVPSGYRGRPS